MRRRRTSKEILKSQRRRNLFHRTIRIMAIVITALILGKSVSSSKAAGTDVPEEIQTIAEEIGQQYCICPEFLEAIAYRESGYDPEAADGGCVGLMQIDPLWHQARMKRLGAGDLTDAYSNMLVAADYLAELFEKYEDPGMVLMVYADIYIFGDITQNRGGLSGVLQADSDRSSYSIAEEIANIPENWGITVHINSNGGQIKKGLGIRARKQREFKQDGAAQAPKGPQF